MLPFAHVVKLGCGGDCEQLQRLEEQERLASAAQVLGRLLEPLGDTIGACFFNQGLLR